MQKTQATPEHAPLAKRRNEKLINRWCFLLEQGRQELHLRQWFIAASYYQQALSVAETLFSASLCKSCALRCYMRTLVEYAYITCKINGPESMDFLGQVATVTLSAYMPMQAIDKLLVPVMNLKSYSDQEQDVWINQLFVEDVLQRSQLH